MAPARLARRSSTSRSSSRPFRASCSSAHPRGCALFLRFAKERLARRPPRRTRFSVDVGSPAGYTFRSATFPTGYTNRPFVCPVGSPADAKVYSAPSDPLGSVPGGHVCGRKSVPSPVLHTRTHAAPQAATHEVSERSERGAACGAGRTGTQTQTETAPHLLVQSGHILVPHH